MMRKNISAFLLPTVITIIFVATILLPCLAYVYLDFTNKIPALSPSFMITAHTGAENTKDNSLESIVKGIDAGANCVEFDIRFLNDGTPILCHDEKQKSNKSVKLDSALNLLYLYSIKINFDLKETSHIEKVAELVSFYGLEDRCFFTGITYDMAAKVKTFAPNIDFYLNIKLTNSQKNDSSYALDLGKTAKDLGSIGVNLKYAHATYQNVKLWHSQNLLVSVYTANTALDINAALYKNVDNITTLKPLKAISLARKGLAKSQLEAACLQI
jgi:glycerophosphoryl diester phosphodiesterase